MKIFIDRHTTIKDIQDAFQVEYPFLNIQFSDKKHEYGMYTEDGHWYDPCFKIRRMTKRPLDLYITIHPWHRTGDIEADFESVLSLHPQIFRLEENGWIETAGTDIFSVEEQNYIGRKLAEERGGNLWIERECVL